MQKTFFYAVRPGADYVVRTPAASETHEVLMTIPTRHKTLVKITILLSAFRSICFRTAWLFAR